MSTLVMSQYVCHHVPHDSSPNEAKSSWAFREAVKKGDQVVTIAVAREETSVSENGGLELNRGPVGTACPLPIRGNPRTVPRLDERRDKPMPLWVALWWCCLWHCWPQTCCGFRR